MKPALTWAITQHNYSNWRLTEAYLIARTSHFTWLCCMDWEWSLVFVFNYYVLSLLRLCQSNIVCMSCQETMTGSRHNSSSRQALVLHVLPSSSLCFSISVLLNVVAFTGNAGTFQQIKINANLTWKIFLLQFLVKNLLHLIHHITPSYNGNGYLLNSKACTYCCIWSVKTWECSIWE